MLNVTHAEKLTAAVMAGRYRECNRRDLADHGLVVTFDGEAIGWTDKLRDPERYVPGVIATDAHGNQYLATGGDDHHGAQQWEPLP